MSEEELKKSYLNCFLDLQRAATAFYLNPSGKTHLVFFDHAQKILKRIKERKAKRFLARISELRRKTLQAPKSQKTYLADEILTTGILLK